MPRQSQLKNARTHQMEDLWTQHATVVARVLLIVTVQMGVLSAAAESGEAETGGDAESCEEHGGEEDISVVRVGCSMSPSRSDEQACSQRSVSVSAVGSGSGVAGLGSLSWLRIALSCV